MLNRRAVLVISVLLSVALHAGLIAVSDRVPLMALAIGRDSQFEVFRVNLVDAPIPPPESVAAAAEPGTGKRPAPATVEELLEQEIERLDPQELSLMASVEIPQLAERLAEKSLDREHNLDLSEDTLQRIDSKLVEIAAAEARRDIEVPRRLVRPSSTRVAGENEFPTLGGDAPVAEMLPLSGPGFSSFGTEPAGGDAAALPAAAAVALAPENEPLPSLEAPPELIELPMEEQVARAPVAEELRTENPYEFMDDLLDIDVASFVPPGEKQGYFRIRISPKKDGKIQVLPKDVTFVIDASNSILQRKLEATIAGLQAVIKQLRAEDRFNVVIFRDTPKQFQPDRVYATNEKKAAAVAFLEGQKSFGETDVFNAIRPVVTVPPREGVPGMVLVVTDGRPTAGVRDGRTIINLLTDENGERNPIFAFGGGNTVNRYLLDLLAYRNKGESYVSKGIETMGADLPAFFAQLNDPLLKDLEAAYANVDESTVFPKELPDFFRSRAVTVYGRFNPATDDDLVMRLVGQAGPRQKEVVFRADLKKAKSGDEQIARNWAFRKIYYLIGEMCREGETPERISQLRQLGRQYGIRTSYDE